ncbi:AfsR/SARP family transcriptional regulator [Streptomyces sp. AC563]|uniref:AfsR/SARP family transcriptional regulator n=2 Tax=Streptomyces buecherae TaxID=2763006 RepID=UPI00164CFB1D|nr:AfsR/SARP family transcriptional regulator [Streptomyces buecherae]MBC3989119.1 AfsR/SARP family transcriptional regulator [Streptomyces buecherae]
MRYEIMGPLRVVDGEEKSSIRARKIEVLLTVLLVRSDQVVPVDHLITEIWGEEPPRRVIAGLHVYISQIRKFLNRPDRDESPVLTRPPGYVLRLGPDELDIRHFERLVNDGRHHSRAHRYGQAAHSFESALALWRGPLLDDVCCGPILEGFQTWLYEARLECVEMLMDARLMLGRHRELVSDLYQLATEHPLREALHRQLMLALYRSGRRADALHVYQSARKTLNEELGLEPCRDLQALQQAILTSDDRLELPMPLPA